MTTLTEKRRVSQSCLALAVIEFCASALLAFFVEYIVATFFFLAGLAFAAVAYLACKQMHMTAELDELFVRRMKDPEHAAYWSERANDLLDRMR